MKSIAHLLVLSLAIIATGCETTRKGACCTASQPAQAPADTVAKVGDGLFWLGQSALLAAANDTVRTESPYPN